MTVKERFKAREVEKPNVIDLIRSKDRLWTADQIAKATGIDAMKIWPELKAEHNRGNIVAVKVFASGGQERASAVYYGKTMHLVSELIDEIELGD